MRTVCLEAPRIEDFTRFKFADETGTNRMYCRRYARAEGGQRAHQATPLHGGPNVTLVAALEAVSQDAAHWIKVMLHGKMFWAGG